MNTETSLLNKLKRAIIKVKFLISFNATKMGFLFAERLLHTAPTKLQ